VAQLIAFPRGAGFRRRQPLFAIGTADPATDAAERWLRQYERETAGDDRLDTIPAAIGSFGLNENVFDFAGNAWEDLFRSSDIVQPTRERQSRPGNGGCAVSKPPKQSRLRLSLRPCPRRANASRAPKRDGGSAAFSMREGRVYIASKTRIVAWFSCPRIYF
jgi:hypothetical protein